VHHIVFYLELEPVEPEVSELPEEPGDFDALPLLPDAPEEDVPLAPEL